MKAPRLRRGRSIRAERVKVLEGREGQLFMRDDRNRVLDQHTGRRRLGAGGERRWRRLLAGRREALDRLGIPLAAVVAPDKEAVYSDCLPAAVRPAGRRPVHAVQHAAGQAGIELGYPVEELREARELRPTYYRTDSHWNSWGAFVAYRTLCSRIVAAGVPLVPLEADEIEWIEHCVPGDLGSKLDPPVSGPTVFGRLREHRSKLSSDNLIANHGRIITFEADEPGRPTGVLFGESFSNHMLAFLKEGCGRLTFVHTSAFDFELLSELDPDFLAWTPTERFLIDPPSDRRAAQRRRAIQARKRRAGQIRDGGDRFLSQIPLRSEPGAGSASADGRR